jgi:hypothetical protein
MPICAGLCAYDGGDNNEDGAIMLISFNQQDSFQLRCYVERLCTDLLRGLVGVETIGALELLDKGDVSLLSVGRAHFSVDLLLPCLVLGFALTENQHEILNNTHVEDGRRGPRDC